MKQKENPQNPQPSFARRLWVSILILLSLLVIGSAIAFIAGLAQENPDANTALIRVDGVIASDTDASLLSQSVASSTEIVRELEKARDDDNIKAVILEINSPGGSPVPSDEIAQAVKEVRAQNKTVVAWIRDEGASGGYWVASATDHIVANRMSITGSIGVYGSYLQFDRFLAHWNVSYNQLVAGDHKDIGDPFVNLTDSDRAFLQGKLDTLHDFFIQEVASNRNMSVSDVRALADGRIFLGVEAKGNGLVDELGGKPEAVAYIQRRIGGPVVIAEYAPEQSFIDRMLGVLDKSRQPSLESMAQQSAVDAQTPSFSLR